MRLFLGIPIPDQLRIMLSGHKWPDGIRAVPAQNLHITLAFIGETPVGQLDEIRNALGKFNFETFDAVTTGYGVFPDMKKPHVIWAGVEPLNPFQLLHKQCEELLAFTGYKPERRAFIPHITVGRIKTCRPELLKMAINENPSPEGFVFQVNKINLYESILKKRGAEYRVLESIDRL